MDLNATLGILAVILGFGSIIGTIFFFLLHPHHGIPGAAAKRIVIGLSSLAVVVVLLFLQYTRAPNSSILTYVGFPFPGSTLQACHVTWKPLLAFTTHQSGPPNKSLTGLAPDDAKITISGSSALAPLFQSAGKAFDAANGTTTTVTSSNSYAGLTDVTNHVADIGLADFFQNEAPRDDPSLPAVYSYPNLDDFLIAAIPFTLIVNSDLSATVQNLTVSEVRGIFGGTITNWRQIGGPDVSITPFQRSTGSGTRLNFEEIVGHLAQRNQIIAIDGTSQLIQNIAATKGAIGYAALSGIATITPDLRDQIAPVCLDGHAATTTDITAGAYPFWGFEHAFIRLSARALRAAPRALLGFVCFGNFQTEDILRAGFLPITQIPDAVRAQRYPNLSQTLDCGAQWFAEMRS